MQSSKGTEIPAQPMALLSPITAPQTEDYTAGFIEAVNQNIQELNALIKWYHENKNKLHPLILAFEFHRKYEFIHPFLDGNGRTGRLIMNKILMTNKYSQIIVYKDNKQAYFSALEKSKSKNPKNYYQFMLEQADKSYDYLLEILKKY